MDLDFTPLIPYILDSARMIFDSLFPVFWNAFNAQPDLTKVTQVVVVISLVSAVAAGNSREVRRWLRTIVQDVFQR
jgi:hypothetical protein